MPISVTSVQIDLDKKNILAFSFANEADQIHFEQRFIERFKDELVRFMNDPAEVVIVMALAPGKAIKLIKVDTSEAIDATPPSYRPD